MRLRAPLVAVAAVALLAGCGKKGPPLPPLLGAVPRVSDLEVRQVGTTVRARFTLPVREGSETVDYQPRTAELWVRPVPKTSTGTDQVAAAPPRPRPGTPPAEDEGLPVRDFTSVGRLLVTVSGGDLFEVLSLPDPELVATIPGDLVDPVEVALVLQTDVRRAGTVSNVVPWTPAPPPAPPTGVAATPGDRSLRVDWVAAVPAEGEKLGVNVYRALEDDPFPSRPANPQPLQAPPFQETPASEGTTYRYLLRTVVIGAEPPVESDAAPEVVILFEDVVAPAVPQGLRAVADAGSAVTLIWAPGTDRDLGGYHVYRRAPAGEWERLDARPVTSASFTDSTARGGATYEYAVTAHDTATPENESAKSSAVRVAIPSSNLP